MATITITGTAQSIPNSNNGVICSSTVDFLYGFGATAPTEWITADGNEPLDYGGAYGLMWVKLANSTKTATLSYFGV